MKTLRLVPVLILSLCLGGLKTAKAEQQDSRMEKQTNFETEFFEDNLMNRNLAPLDQRQDAVCTRLEEQLLETQAMAEDIEEKAFQRTDTALKSMYTQVCEQKRYDLATLDRVETDLDSLDASLAYGEILVKKKKHKRKRKFRSKRRGGFVSPGRIDRHSPRILINSGVNFPRAHAACAPGCSYVSWGIWGDAAHRRRRSCHNSGDAIDIHGIRCGGNVATGGSGKFRSYVDCMGRQGLGIIYNRPDIGKANQAHKNHAHFQLPNCRKI